MPEPTVGRSFVLCIYLCNPSTLFPAGSFLDGQKDQLSLMCQSLGARRTSPGEPGAVHNGVYFPSPPSLHPLDFPHVVLPCQISFRWVQHLKIGVTCRPERRPGDFSLLTRPLPYPVERCDLGDRPIRRFVVVWILHGVVSVYDRRQKRGIDHRLYNATPNVVIHGGFVWPAVDVHRALAILWNCSRRQRARDAVDGAPTTGSEQHLSLRCEYSFVGRHRYGLRNNC